MPRSLITPLLIAVGWLLLVPEDAAAWAPGTHVALGEAVLASLHLLPPAVAALLGRYPIHFLYGSVAPDISFAKKYVPEGRHCHHWHVGEEIFESADSEALQAVGLGYLAHLAADTVAHNLYVPRQLVSTRTAPALGHTYWEHRMDIHVGEIYLGKARRLVLHYDHGGADRMFRSVLSDTLFSFGTNRRLFRGMVRMQDDPRWKQIFDQVLRNSRFSVSDPVVDRYVGLAFDRIVDYLVARGDSETARWDPVGEEPLRQAKELRGRRLATKIESVVDPEIALRLVDDLFPFPSKEPTYRPSRPVVAGEARRIIPSRPRTPTGIR